MSTEEKVVTEVAAEAAPISQVETTSAPEKSTEKSTDSTTTTSTPAEKEETSAAEAKDVATPEVAKEAVPETVTPEAVVEKDATKEADSKPAAEAAADKEQEATPVVATKEAAKEDAKPTPTPDKDTEKTAPVVAASAPAEGDTKPTPSAEEKTEKPTPAPAPATDTAKPIESKPEVPVAVAVAPVTPVAPVAAEKPVTPKVAEATAPEPVPAPVPITREISVAVPEEPVKEATTVVAADTSKDVPGAFEVVDRAPPVKQKLEVTEEVVAAADTSKVVPGAFEVVDKAPPVKQKLEVKEEVVSADKPVTDKPVAVTTDKPVVAKPATEPEASSAVVAGKKPVVSAVTTPEAKVTAKAPVVEQKKTEEKAKVVTKPAVAPARSVSISTVNQPKETSTKQAETGAKVEEKPEVKHVTERKAYLPKQIPPTQLHNLFKSHKVTVVDVRPYRDALKTGVIPNSCVLPCDQVEHPPIQHVLDYAQTRPLLITCKSGLMATRVTAELKKAGKENVCVLAGGFIAYLKAGLIVAAYRRPLCEKPAAVASDESQLTKASPSCQRATAEIDVYRFKYLGLYCVFPEDQDQLEGVDKSEYVLFEDLPTQSTVQCQKYHPFAPKELIWDLNEEGQIVWVRYN